MENISVLERGEFERKRFSFGFLIKRFFDMGLSGIGIVGSLPLWGMFVLAIKLEDGGPIFYKQERVGTNGKIFDALKFRSMIPDAEKGLGAVQATESDPRITTVGKFLRATAMDELPQLWNIFKGDMSFVGPRALRPNEFEVKEEDLKKTSIEEVQGYQERITVRPGLTGLAQVYLPSDAKRRHKFRYDSIYIRNCTFLFDLKLILLSFYITFRGRWESREGKI